MIYYLWESNESSNKCCNVGGAEASGCVISDGSAKASALSSVASALSALVVTDCDVVEDIGVGSCNLVEGRVEEADGFLACSETSSVDETDDSAPDRSTARGSIDLCRLSLCPNNVVVTQGTILKNEKNG